MRRRASAMRKIVDLAGSDIVFPAGEEFVEPRRARSLRSPTAPHGLGTWEADLKLGRLDWSYSAARILGLEGGPPSLKLFLKTIHPEDRAFVLDAIRASLQKRTPLQMEHRIVLAGGLIRYVRHSADYRLDRHGKPIWIRGVLEDVTEQKHAEELSWYRSNFDGLTRLPNRALFGELLDRAFNHARRSRSMVAVLYIDIDGFRVVNEIMGLRTGDFVLQRVADRLRSTLRATDCIARSEKQTALARLGSDEFVVAISDVKSPDGAARAASRLLDAFRSSLELGEKEIFLTATIGIALHPPDAKDVETLVQHAETAMHHAKAQARGSYRFYTDAMNETVMRKIDLESRLRKAVETDQLFLEYQPIVDLQTARIVGAEALLRWNCPELGPVQPTEFIPIAEENVALITSIESWALETACRQMKKWRDEGLPVFRLSVNASRSQLKQSNFASRIAEVLSVTALDSSQFQLELTENGVIGEDPATIQQLCELKRMGVSLAIDDFGAGSSALGYLRKFPVDVLKIDRSFVARIPDNGPDDAFVSAVIAMAHCLGIRVVAEGVETEAQLDLLARIGCDEVQGFLLARPQSTEGFRRALVRNQMESSCGGDRERCEEPIFTEALGA